MTHGACPHGVQCRPLQLWDLLLTISTVFADMMSTVMGIPGCLLVHGVVLTVQAALKLSWRSSTKLLIHFGDAPAHGTMYHNGYSGDSHPAGDPTGTPPSCIEVSPLPSFSSICTSLRWNKLTHICLVMTCVCLCFPHTHKVYAKLD